MLLSGQILVKLLGTSAVRKGNGASETVAIARLYGDSLNDQCPLFCRRILHGDASNWRRPGNDYSDVIAVFQRLGRIRAAAVWRTHAEIAHRSKRAPENHRTRVPTRRLRREAGERSVLFRLRSPNGLAPAHRQRKIELIHLAGRPSHRPESSLDPNRIGGSSLADPAGPKWCWHPSFPAENSVHPPPTST